MSGTQNKKLELQINDKFAAVLFDSTPVWRGSVKVSAGKVMSKPSTRF